MTATEPRAQAIALARAGRLAEAAAALERLLATAPKDAAAWAMLGQLRLDLGRSAEALAAFDEAVALQSERAENHLNRGVALGRLERHAEALDDYDKALALRPDLAVAHANRAQALNELSRHEEAAEAALGALRLHPGDVGALNHLGVARHAQRRYDEALEAFRQALKVRPAHHDSLCNLGMTLTALGRHAEAVTALDAAVAAHPDSSLARYRRAHARLPLGDFEGGWADYEHRWATPLFTARARGQVPAPLIPRLTIAPTPEDLAGRRVLVVAEQGVGDEIMFASILPDLAAVAREVALVCEPRLVGLFSASFPQIACLDPEAARSLRGGAFDRIVSLGSLAHAWRRRREDFPGRSYLRPPADAAAAWRERLAAGDAGPAPLRIGISWRGGLARTGASARSMPLERLARALSAPGRELVSLQYGDPREEIATVNAGLPTPVRAFGPAEIDDFSALAGLVTALDLVVTVQTALVHLAGALGRPALVMIPKTPEWRYGASGETLPWYGSARLFRQGPDGQWGPVLERIVRAVAEIEGGRAPADAFATVSARD